MKRSINGDADEAQDETSPFLGSTRHRHGCRITVCLTVLVIMAAVTVIVVSIVIADKQQLHAQLMLDIGSVDGDFAFWDPTKQVLFWVDRQLQEVNIYNPGEETNRKFQFSHSVGVVVPRLNYNDSVIITTGKYVAYLNLTTGEETIVTPMSDGPDDSISFSDGRCDPSGGLWASASLVDGPQNGTLYRIDALQNVTAMLQNVSTPGGMAWSKDRKTFYFIDSKHSRVNAYAYNAKTGSISFQKIAFTVPSSFGVLSGMSIDAHDSLWIAIIGPQAVNGTGRVCRYDAVRGLLQESILLPVSSVTSCVFGGANLDQLYITTRSKPGEAHSGGIYVAKHLGVRGARPFLYGG